MSGERSGDGRGHTLTRRTRGARARERGGRALTGHLCFRALVVDGLAGERVHADLGDGQRGVLQLAVEPQHLSPLAGVLHHLPPRCKKKTFLLTSATCCTLISPLAHLFEVKTSNYTEQQLFCRRAGV